MLNLFKRSPLGFGIGLLVVAILAGILIYLLFNTARIVLTHQAQDAVVTECHGSWAFRNGTQKRYVRTPVAKTADCEKAHSFIRFSRKHLCERLIGTHTTIYLNPDPKGKNTYGGFMAFWLFPAIILIIISAIAGRR